MAHLSKGLDGQEILEDSVFYHPGPRILVGELFISMRRMQQEVPHRELRAPVLKKSSRLSDAFGSIQTPIMLSFHRPAVLGHGIGGALHPDPAPRVQYLLNQAGVDLRRPAIGGWA